MARAAGNSREGLRPGFAEDLRKDRALAGDRFWRDLGYAIGALISGIIADLVGMRAAIQVVGALTLLSGLHVAIRMRETLIRDSNIPPDRIAKYAVLEVNSDGYLRRVIEKPDAATMSGLGPGAPISMNLWLLPSDITEACRRVSTSKSEIM